MHDAFIKAWNRATCAFLILKVAKELININNHYPSDIS